MLFVSSSWIVCRARASPLSSLILKLSPVASRGGSLIVLRAASSLSVRAVVSRGGSLIVLRAASCSAVMAVITSFIMPSTWMAYTGASVSCMTSPSDRAGLHKSSSPHGRRDLSTEAGFNFSLISFCSPHMRRMGFPEELYFAMLEATALVATRSLALWLL